MFFCCTRQLALNKNQFIDKIGIHEKNIVITLILVLHAFVVCAQQAPGINTEQVSDAFTTEPREQYMPVVCCVTGSV